MHQCRPHHFPAHDIMLSGPVSCACHDLIFFLMLKQHSDNRRFRYNRVNARQNIPITFQIDHRLGKARPVVAVYNVNFSGNSTVCVNCRIYRQIAPLGVSHKTQARIRMFCHIFKVCNRFELSRCLRKKTHIKILFPSDNGIICPAVYNITQSVPKFHNHRAEL